MTSSLSNLVDNLAAGVHNIECKYGHFNKKCEKFQIKYKDCDHYLEHANVKDDLLSYKCSCCNSN